MQKEIAERSRSDLEKEPVYKDSIVTEITPFKNFYVAEDYHKNYFEKHHNAAYCNFVIVCPYFHIIPVCTCSRLGFE
jgi:peptide-methionine (S)-S-oxide reductase